MTLFHIFEQCWAQHTKSRECVPMHTLSYQLTHVGHVHCMYLFTKHCCICGASLNVRRSVWLL